MRLRNIPRSQEVIDRSEYVVHNLEGIRGNWKKQIFGNDNPVHIEVGMGKGKFITQLASENPGINYVGIERYTSVLLRAVEKLEGSGMTGEKRLGNLYFLCIDARELPDIFAQEEVEKIYLNFSDPWPKDRHAKRRLPSREFLARYDKILTKNGTVEFKTDNRGLFDFALEEVEPAGWHLIAHTYDLHHDAEMAKGNIMTEYEEKFSAQGNPICKLIIGREKGKAEV